METPVFRSDPDGSVTIESRWPVETLITKELLQDALATFLHRSAFREISITVANGAANYRLLRKGPYPDTFYIRRVR